MFWVVEMRSASLPLGNIGRKRKNSSRLQRVLRSWTDFRLDSRLPPTHDSLRLLSRCLSFLVAREVFPPKGLSPGSIWIKPTRDKALCELATQEPSPPSSNLFKRTTFTQPSAVLESDLITLYSNLILIHWIHYFQIKLLHLRTAGLDLISNLDRMYS